MRNCKQAKRQNAAKTQNKPEYPHNRRPCSATGNHQLPARTALRHTDFARMLQWINANLPYTASFNKIVFHNELGQTEGPIQDVRCLSIGVGACPSATAFV